MWQNQQSVQTRQPSAPISCDDGKVGGIADCHCGAETVGLRSGVRARGAPEGGSHEWRLSGWLV